MSKILLLTTGAESNEAAIKMAKLYTGRYEIVALRPVLARHDPGCGRGDVQRRAAGIRTAAAGNLALPGAERLPVAVPPADGSHDWRAELDYGFEIVDRQSTGSLAACLVEPILSSGGMIELPPGYLGR